MERNGRGLLLAGGDGAGKSTTIKMLTGLLAPTSGEIRVLGRSVVREPLEVKRRIGVVPEDLNLFERLTGAEMLTFIRKFGSPAPCHSRSCAHARRMTHSPMGTISPVSSAR